MSQPSSLSGSRPNIVFVLADDLSYRDLSCFGQIQFQTPTLDRLCASGIRFDDAYSGSPECAPARGSLLTGMHMGHCRIRLNQSARGQDHLEPEDVTIGEALKSAGYATCMVGKWGAALPGTPGTPDKKGFDTSFGFYDQRRAHTYYPHYLYENGVPVPLPENYGYDMDYSYRHTRDPEAQREYDADGKLIPRGVKAPAAASNSEILCHRKALQFIDAHAHEPFFLYYSTQLPHGPVVAPELGELKDKPWDQRRREWAAMVQLLDRHVAGLLERLESHGVLDNTLLVFASDNGYAHWGYMGRRPYTDDPVFRNKGPWRGGKFIALDGGVRVPMFVTWPGRVKPGCSDALVSLYDLLATFSDLAGVDPIPKTDGISFVRLLEGRVAEQERHEFLYWESGGHARHAQSARLGKWFAWRRHPSKPLELYDTELDVGSETDVADKHPDVVRRVLALFEREHVDSEWYLNPGETDEQFQAKKDRAEAEGCLQIATAANTEYRGAASGTTPAPGTVNVDPSIPD